MTYDPELFTEVQQLEAKLAKGKCREAFEAHCKTQVIELDSQFAIDLYFDWQAAWDARGKVDVEICKELSIRFAEAMNRKATYGAVKCEIAIKQEQCMK